MKLSEFLHCWFSPDDVRRAGTTLIRPKKEDEDDDHHPTMGYLKNKYCEKRGLLVFTNCELPLWVLPHRVG